MGDTRTCVFQWKVGYYYSMLTGLNRPCGNCPFNQSDCLRSGCVTLNGISRPVATVNREVPGPKIIVCQGDTIVVNVTNLLEDMTGITFHWHGEDPHQNLYDVDDSSHILFLQDWMNITQSTNFLKYLFDIGENKPDFLLINGQGKGPPFYQGFDEPFFTPRYVLYVERFRRYRLRLINNGFTACPFQVTIDSHELLLIAADGSPIQATSCDGIFMTSGERFDVVIHANQTIGNYWVRLLGLEYECSTCKEFAILRYKGAQETFPLLPESPTAMPKLVANVPDNPPVEFPDTFKLTDLRSLGEYMWYSIYKI
ncbi:laccase-type phenoloxidase [Apostichopus japonicus]|uniref:Laccase-type phenoloxidase n=1 Tax=Stichopus japonicus TaxID=307972 RepID=A0A2G8KDV2_STIJA|nr:laccase-type phenoloxidase [Apostichopus japonicus]